MAVSHTFTVCIISRVFSSASCHRNFLENSSLLKPKLSLTLSLKAWPPQQLPTYCHAYCEVSIVLSNT